MSGVCHGVMTDQNGKLISGRNNTLNSGFVGILSHPSDGTDPTKTSWTAEDNGSSWPDSKYYDAYSYATSNQNFQRGFLGDATKEMGPFGEIIFDTITGNSTGSGQKIHLNSSFGYTGDSTLL